MMSLTGQKVNGQVWRLEVGSENGRCVVGKEETSRDIFSATWYAVVWTTPTDLRKLYPQPHFHTQTAIYSLCELRLQTELYLSPPRTKEIAGKYFMKTARELVIRASYNVRGK
jgi:hypothetical protein